MAEYIEREALRDKISDTDWYHLTTHGNLVIGAKDEDSALYKAKDVFDAVETAPAADVVEVRHGEWDDNIIAFCNVCMECGAIVERTAIKNKSRELNYCPNCGAKMDGKGEGE